MASGKFPPPGWATETPHGGLALELRRSAGAELVRRIDLRSGGGRRVFVVGRQPGVADVLITEDEAVSRQHAAIVPRGEALYIIDLKSAAGTWVNGPLRHLPAPHSLHPRVCANLWLPIPRARAQTFDSMSSQVRRPHCPAVPRPLLCAQPLIC